METIVGLGEIQELAVFQILRRAVIDGRHHVCLCDRWYVCRDARDAHLVSIRMQLGAQVTDGRRRGPWAAKLLRAASDAYSRTFGVDSFSVRFCRYQAIAAMQQPL
jgi:hypothetical protein